MGTVLSTIKHTLMEKTGNEVEIDLKNWLELNHSVYRILNTPVQLEIKVSKICSLFQSALSSAEARNKRLEELLEEEVKQQATSFALMDNYSYNDPRLKDKAEAAWQQFKNEQGI